MSRRDPLVFVHHMLDHAIEAREMTRGRSRDDLDSNRMLELAVKVQPKARRNVVEVLDDGTVKVWVTAPPEKGRANDAVEKLLAARLRLPKSSVAVVRGHRSRNKVIRFEGLDKREIVMELGATG